MQITAPQLTPHLQRGLKNLYTLHGDEPLLVQEAADQLRATARAQGFTERSVHIAQGARFDWSAVLASGSEMSLFADKQIIEIRVPSGKPGKEGSVALQHLAERAGREASDAAGASTLTLVLLPRLDGATSKSAWFETLERCGVAIKFDAIDRRNLPQWIAQRLQLQGQRVAAGEEGQRTLAFFADRVEGNLLAAHQEIQKLALLHPPAAADGGVLGFAQVESAVLNVARYDVFKLAEAVLGGQPLRAARMLDGLQAEGEAEVLVHWALSEDIRSLKRVKAAMAAGRPMPMALRENRVWGAKEKLYERVLPQLSQAVLSDLLAAAHQVDGIVKGLKQPDWPASGWQALHRLAAMVCAQCAAPLAGTGKAPLRSPIAVKIGP
ncbi:MAG: DNA polymerase III subunit delta [Polaromonas sp.]|nr:DNA polymerase III subunit delta [Polaromonas sp.]